MTDYEELTWDGAMRRGHIEKHLRRSEVKAAQAQVWLALARELAGQGQRYGHVGT